MQNNIHYTNNTPMNIDLVFPYFQEAYKTGVLHDDVADLFSINIIKGINPDGTDRMIINMA